MGSYCCTRGVMHHQSMHGCECRPKAVPEQSHCRGLVAITVISAPSRLRQVCGISQIQLFIQLMVHGKLSQSHLCKNTCATQRFRQLCGTRYNSLRACVCRATVTPSRLTCRQPLLARAMPDSQRYVPHCLFARHSISS